MEGGTNDVSQPNWRRRHWVYTSSLILYFAVVFYFAHNRILFGQWMPFTKADLVPLVQQQLAGVVRAMKEYQSIHGMLPDSERDLTPWFPQKDVHTPNGHLWGVEIWRGGLYYRHSYGQVSYHFPPGQEGWEIHGSILNGSIPAPIVLLPPTTLPSTKP